jgi:diguanylate cyclase (GGDEF)-like protein/PAS domain S-box-containing protein
VPDDPEFGVELKAAIEALRRRTQQYRLLAEQAADAVLLVTPGGRLLNVNLAACNMLFYSRDQLLRMRFSDLLAADQIGEDAMSVLRLTTGESRTQPCRMTRRDGRAIEALLSATRLPDGRLQVVVHDQTERVRAAEALRESEERYRTLAEASPDAVLVEADGRIVFANRAARRLLGVDGGGLTNKLLVEIIQQEDRDAAAEAIGRAATAGRAGARVSFRLRRADGQVVETSGAATAVSYRGLPAVQVLLRDLGKDRRSGGPDGGVARGGVRDNVTGLTSQALVNDRLSVALAQAYRYRARVGVLYVDLDRFASVNAVIGRASADRMLRAVARRLTLCLREGDTVSRLDSGAFVLVLPGLRHAEDAGTIAEKVLRGMRKPFALRDRVAQVTASVGVAVFPEDGEDAETLLAAAERAMKKAREAGGDRGESPSDALEPSGFDLLELEVGLRAALGRGQMSINGVPAQPGVLHYQPFYALGTSRILGVEALLRWQHPHLGLVFPQDFLSKADFAGLILAIGPWILRTACLQVRTWQRKHRNLRLAVNLSAPEMLRHDLAEQIQAGLDDTGFPARLLQVEVPESHVMQDVPRAEKALRRLKDVGVSVMLDRFGVGYASLSRLAQLPADGVKLDLAFQRGATANPDDASLLTAVVAVARSLKLRIAAQGVETEAQMELLRELGCDEVQGYLLSPPVPVAGCEAILNARPSVAASAPSREGRGGSR